MVRFRLKTAFAEEPLGSNSPGDGVIYREPTFRVSTALLDHRTPCLAFALAEAAHVNVWKPRLAELGLSVGPWLRALKRAVIENRPDDHPIRIDSRPAASDESEIPLGRLRDIVTVTPGQKIAYVTDAADTPANREAIIGLARNADILFIEAAFAQADGALAVERAHLTTAAAGRIAREAGVRRVEPFHFSPRYGGEEARLLSEVVTAFRG
jgi:ribonuclease Z